jgi:hypothetical protein
MHTTGKNAVNNSKSSYIIDMFEPGCLYVHHQIPFIRILVLEVTRPYNGYTCETGIRVLSQDGYVFDNILRNDYWKKLDG